MALSWLIEDVQIGSTKLPAGSSIGDDEVPAVLAVGGVLVAQGISNALDQAARAAAKLIAAGNFPAARQRMLLGFAGYALETANDAGDTASTALQVVTTLATNGRFPTQFITAVDPGTLQALAAGVKTYTFAPIVLPVGAVLLTLPCFSGVGLDDTPGPPTGTTYTMSGKIGSTSLWTAENVKRTQTFPKLPSAPVTSLLFPGNNGTFSGAQVDFVLTSSADLNTVDAVGGITLTFYVFVTA